MPPPSVPIYRSEILQADRWTQIEWYVGTLWLTKRYVADNGGYVDWRWFSGGLVPHWWGSFQGSACISIPPGIYTSLEFKPQFPTTFTISAYC